MTTMRQIQFNEPGRPADIAKCVLVPEPLGCKDLEVLVRTRSFPVNPADLLTLKGVYPRENPNDLSLGNEAAGIVEAVGRKVKVIVPGDKVFLLTQNNWSEKKIVPSNMVVKVDEDFDLNRAALLKVNPATALLMLQEFSELRRGDWIVQTAANSSVGRCVIQIANTQGYKTLNVVRRESAVSELYSLGADMVLIDNGDLEAQFESLDIRDNLKLALDCVRGETANALVKALGNSGMLVTYRAMSSSQMSIDPGTFVFKDIHARGFWLTKYLRQNPIDVIAQMYEELIVLVQDNHLKLSNVVEFNVNNLREALIHAEHSSGSGKASLF